MILEHSTQLSGAWLSTIPREYISLLPKTAIDIGISSRLLMTPYKCGSPLWLRHAGGRDVPFRDIVGGSGAKALRFVGAPGEDQAAAAAAATGFVAGGIAAAGLQPESAHYARSRPGSSARMRRSYECVRSIIRALRADGAVLSVYVTPFVVSAGGGIMEVTDALLPSAKGRSGRHYERQHLSGILIKYRHRLAAEFVSRCGARAGVAFDRHGTA
jgi:hypothetical protein